MIELYEKGGFTPLSPEHFLERVSAREYDRARPFAPTSLAILADISKRLLAAPEARAAPQLTALGFWLRPSQIRRMQQSFEHGLPKCSLGVARGIAFHLPPQNVDTLFVYSWALSLLAGNVNVVRLPSQMPDLLTWLLSVVEEVLAEHGAAQSHFFCRFDIASDCNAAISALADLRVIWGGDAKVHAVSKDPVRPDGLSIGFPDRKSFSVLSASTYEGLSEEGRAKLASQLYNDIFWFDQMGCGSPRILFWLGQAGGVANDLYQRLDKLAEQKAYTIETGIALNKFTFMNELVAAEKAHTGTRFSNRLNVLEAELSPGLLDTTQGAGMVIDVRLNNVQNIAPVLDRRTQTITHFGLTAAELEELAGLMAQRGGYRLVPVGEALSFADIWDGLPLLSLMTRQISVQTDQRPPT